MDVNLPFKAFMYIAQPTLLSIFEDMVKKRVTSENLLEIKNKLYLFSVKLTGKTTHTWDDDLCTSILDVITKPASFTAWGDPLLDIAEEWIKASETKWDDLLLQPVITTFRAVAGIPDGES